MRLSEMDRGKKSLLVVVKSRSCGTQEISKLYNADIQFEETILLQEKNIQ